MSQHTDMDGLRDIFVDECNEGLDAIAQSLIALEADGAHPDARHEIFRVAHTIKGGAAMMGYETVAQYAHLFEDALEPLREGREPLTPIQATLLLQASDALRTMVTAESTGRTITIREHDRALLLQLAPSRGADPAMAPAPGLTDDVLQPRAQALRVEMEKLDAMLTLSGEIAVAQQRLQQRLRSAAPREEALMSAEELERVLGELQDRIMRLRLVALGPVFRPHLRTVRDIAAMQGKQVRLEIEGEDVEVDASIVHQLRDPLVHMIRNAVDHGVERPAERVAAGKPAQATIHLRAAHERGHVVITVTDDGGGLRRDRLLAAARARGMAADATPTDAELHALILQPGFSTAAEITHLSGRGVGMDVVRQRVEALRGTLSLRSVEGQGTTVTLRLPLTIAIIDGFLVGVGAEHFVIPADSVRECLAFATTTPAEATGVACVRGEALPYARLSSVFGVGSPPAPRENLVVVQHEGVRFGLVVDHLLGERQAVLKPLDRLFDSAPGVAGSTILGDGRVSLIVDVAHLSAMLTAA